MTSLAFDGTPNDTPVGYFTYIVDDDHWSWSAGLYALHGYEPHEVEATTTLMLKHKHPDDTARTFEVLETVIKDAAPFSCYHRIIDAQEQIRFVLSVGRGLVGPQGKVEQVTGFFVDLTQVRQSETRHEIELALVEVAETRSMIEQATGIVMAEARCDPDEAFAMLREYSSQQNVQLSEVSRRLVARVSDPPACQTAHGSRLSRTCFRTRGCPRTSMSLTRRPVSDGATRTGSSTLHGPVARARTDRRTPSWCAAPLSRSGARPRKSMSPPDLVLTRPFDRSRSGGR